jgi:hypothetical protein
MRFAGDAALPFLIALSMILAKTMLVKVAGRHVEEAAAKWQQSGVAVVLTVVAAFGAIHEEQLIRVVFHLEPGSFAAGLRLEIWALAGEVVASAVKVWGNVEFHVADLVVFSVGRVAARSYEQLLGAVVPVCCQAGQFVAVMVTATAAAVAANAAPSPDRGGLCAAGLGPARDAWPARLPHPPP